MILRAMTGALARLAIGLVLVIATALGVIVPARANHTGAHAFSLDCAISGCHLSGNNAYMNGANASNIIDHAITNFMTSAPVGGTPQIASYIATLLPAQSPSNQAVSFNFGPALGAGDLFDLPDIYHSTTWGGGATSAIAHDTDPANGSSIAYSSSGLAYRALYKASACAVGGSTFTYHAAGSGGSTSVRTGSVVIANPPSPPTISSGSPPGGQTGVAYSHTVTVSLCPALVTYSFTGTLPPGLSLNASSGVISGTPTTTAGSPFSFTIIATYTGGQFTSQAYSVAIGLGPPVVNSASPAPNSSVGVLYSGYTITATNSPFTGFAASGLPPGLTVNTSTGAITGTPTSAAGSPYSASVSATNATSTGSKTVVFNVVPSIGSSSTASGQTGVAFSYQITANAGPAFTSYAALDPLPTGLTLSTSSGLISGSPSVVGGPTSVRLTGSNAFGTSAQFTLMITITLGPPVITNSPLTASGGEGIAFTPFQITATNPPFTAFGATGLPSGLSMSPTGLITGTPAAASAGLYPVTISATNAINTGSATLNITISAQAPVNTSLAPPAGQTGVAYSFQITANFAPTSFNAANLPPGLTVNTSTGLISGIPTAVGTFSTASITSTNGAGFDTDTVTFTITLGPPVISSSPTAGGAVGFAFSYQIVASNSPTLYAASNLPPGVTINPSTGLISGTPTANGSYVGTMSATNSNTTTTVPLTITIAVGIPAVTSASASGATGQSFNYQVLATNGPTSYAATGLPAGLVINPTNGRISGIPTASGTFSVGLSATNGTGTGTGVLTLAIALSGPVVTSAPAITVATGGSFYYEIQVQNGPATFSATGLPAGLTLDPTSGHITGTITAGGGTYNVTITATNATGSTTFVLHITVGFVIARAGNATVNVVFQETTAIPLPVAGDVTTVNIVSLPSHGLVTTQPGSATVIYTPAIGYSGADSFTYTVTNPAGTSTLATVNIIVGSLAPLAGTAVVSVSLNTATVIEMAKFVTGSGLTGVAITTPPTHGTATVNGLTITYTPRTNYFGTDSFAYIAFGELGSSPPAIIHIEVVGRPDPTADRDVVGLLAAQSQAARRFVGAQIGNYQRRMETLHRADPAPPAALAPERTAATAPATLDRMAAPAREPTGWMPISLVETLMRVATTRSLDVSTASGGAESAAFRPQTDLWVGGSANFGNRDASNDRSGLRFGTDGISAGVDRRFSERLVAGVGAGYARDDSDVGTRSRSKATGGSIAGYLSYQPAPRTFIDLLLGYGQLRFDSTRFIEAVDDFATASRKGSQVFGSAAVGYEYRVRNLLVSPYGRLDFAIDRLDAVSESAPGSFALTYDAQTQRSFQAALGVRAESKHETEFGWAVPRVRAEYRRELEGERRATLSYADLFEGQQYSITPAGTSRNSLLFGIGADLIFRGGLRIGIDYEAQRASGASNVQGMRILFTQELDARPTPGWKWEPMLTKYPLNLDAGYAWDDNVTRGREAADKISDRAFSLGMSMTRPFALGTHARLQVTALASGEKFDRHAGLGRFSAGAQGELQYRASGAFDATTYAVVGRAMYEQYESRLRTGGRYFVGVNARRSLTDRIDLFAEVGANARNGRSEVFTWRDYSAKVNLDYSLGRNGVVYLTGEYRRGDTVSTGHPSLVNVGLADVFVADDAFDGLDLVAYRFDARSLLGTVGYNYPLGARDSIDFSWRRVQAAPTARPAFDFSGSLRYIDNQYSVVYLMRF